MWRLTLLAVFLLASSSYASAQRLAARSSDDEKAFALENKAYDLLETIAVKRVFGDDAFRIPISSIKSMLGHTMGAASAIEAAACALAITHGRIPPTINFNEPDPQCDLDYVPNHAREHRVEVAMNNAYAFGGNNASLLLKKCELN